MAITSTTPPVSPVSFNADKTSGCCAAHSLVEVYSTMTRMPGRHPISSEQAMLFIDSIRERLSAVALDDEDWADALKAAASLGIVGGGIYDAIIAHCALKAKADVIYSWNTRHYSLCGAAVARAASNAITDGRMPSFCPPAPQFPKWRKPAIRSRRQP